MRRLIPLTLTLCIAATALADEDVIRKGFTAGDGGTLRLDADLGSIRVVTGGSGVAVEVVRKARGDSGEKRMSGHKVEFRQNGNDVIIEDDIEHRSWSFFGNARYEVQWNIRVPDRYNLEVRTSGGSIEVDDIGGTVDARTSGGSISTGRVNGEATLSTSGGSIRVGGATGAVTAHTSGGSIHIGDTTGQVEARTSGGSISLARTGGDVLARTSGGGIRIEDASGSVDASTSGGSIQASLSRQPAGDSRLATSGGSVTVNLAPGIGAELDARASGGGVTSDVPITVHGTAKDGVLQGKINGGGPKLVLRSSGGGIRVRGQ
jgi:DUF4097 and DUF4098 domain-containing protein YvlB